MNEVNHQDHQQQNNHQEQQNNHQEQHQQQRIVSVAMSCMNRSSNLISFLVIPRAFLSIYLVVTIPLRFAFIPEYGVGVGIGSNNDNLNHNHDYNHSNNDNDHFYAYGSFIILDLLSSIFFVFDAIFIFHHQNKVQSQVTPIQSDSYSHDIGGLGLSSSSISSSQRMKMLRLRKLRRNQFVFIISIISCIPFEYLTLITKDTTIQTNYFLLNKFIRVFFIPTYIEDFSTLLEMRGIVRSMGLQRAWKLFFIMAIAGHWCCCGFYFVAKMEVMYGQSDLTWVEELGLIQSRTETETQTLDTRGDIVMSVSVPEAYIQALYWAYITMITTGFGDIVPLSIPETVWCIFTMALGVMITACAIANLQLVVTNVDAALTNFQRKIETVSKYMKYRRLPNDLQNRVTSFYHYQWDLLRGADEEKFLNELPTSLQQQVSNFMCRDLIASLPVLREANTALLNALADCAEVNTYSPGDDILKPGEQIRGTLLISRGEVEVLVNYRVERRMKRCDTFAEESLFVKRACEKNVRAKTFSEIFLLPSDAFQQIIQAQCDIEHIQQMKDIAVTITNNSKKANKLFGSGEDCIPMNRARKQFHPNSPFRAIWDFCCLIGYLFYIFSLPLMIMRYLDGDRFHDNLISFVVSYIVDLFFAIDLYLCFNCFMYYEEGLVIFDRDRIRRHFAKGHSVVREIISLVPFDLLGLILDTRFCFLCRISKVIRLPKVFKSIDDLNRHLSDFRLAGDLVVFKVITLNCVLLIVCHWVGTMWHGCANLSDQLGFPNNWRKMDEEDETLSIDHSDLGGFGAYLRSVYWAIVGMSTVGYGDIVPTNIFETTFATVVLLFGGLILPAVVGGLAAYLGNVNSTKKNYKKKLVAAKSYMRHCRMDKALINKVTSYYDYLWSRQDAIDEESILNELPWPLRQQVSIHLHRSQIDAVPFFSICDDSVKDVIVSILKPRIFMPMDMVIYKGEIGTSMYFIEKGEVAIVAEDGMAFCVLENGDYFGESSLISSTLLTSSAKALTYCDVFVLQKEDFQGIMEDFISPQKQNEIIDTMKQTMKKKQELNKNISRNLTERPKSCTLVSMIDTRRVKKGDDGRIQGANDLFPSTVPYYPDSKFCLVWNVIVVMICMYNAWIIPFRLAFSSNLSYRVDWCFDCLLMLDMYFNYCKFAFLREGEFVDDIDRVKRRYISSRFKLDFISVLPYDMVCLFIIGSIDAPILMASFRVSRLLRIVRLPQLLSNIFNILEDTYINLAPLRLIEFLSGVVIIAHWAACGFYAFARWKNDKGKCVGLDDGDVLLDWGNAITECRWNDTWIQRQIMNGKISHDGGTIWQRYIRSFNWALPTLVVVVIGDVVPVTSHETLYAFIWMVLGVTINAAIIGNVANIVANIDTDSSAFIKRADEIKKYMHESHISNQLQSRVNYFLASLWEHRESQYEESFVDELPSTLQIQVTQRTRQRHISECPFFDFCSHEIVKALSLRLKLLIFSKGDTIIHQGDMGREMFFLDKGVVDIVSHDGETVFATLEASSESVNSLRNNESAFFGETSLFFKRKRTNTVRASSFCEVYQLHKRDLDRELRQRDFDLTRMLQVFTTIADSNEKRNMNLATNLRLSKSKNSKLFKLIDSNVPNGSRDKKISPLLIPNSTFRKGWDIACIFLTIYFAISLPFRAAFYDDTVFDSFASWLVCDYCIDIFFVVDLFFRFSLFPIISNGSIVTDKDHIRRRCKQSGMLYDILACVPIDLLVVCTGTNNLLKLRLVHIIRILKLPQYFEQVESYLNIYNIRVDAAKRLLFKMFFYYALVNHWCACIWFAIHRFLEPHTKYTWATTDCPHGEEYASSGCLSIWIEEDQAHNVCDGNTIRRCYIRSVYFVLTTLSTVGYGDISPVTELETVFENTVVLIGACFLAGLIGSFAEYLSHNDESGQSAYVTKVQKLQDYMSYRNLPDSLQKEILFFQHHKWIQSHLLDERAVVSILPTPLQMDLSFEILQPMINQFPILTNIETIVKKRISHALTRQVCPPNATIYNAGDIGWDIYFIGFGLIKISLPLDLNDLDEEGRANFSVVKDKAEAIGLLYRPGNHFGESCLKSQSGVRQETVTAKTTATLYFISKESLEDVFSFMSNEQKNKLTKNLLSRNGNVWHTFDSENDSPDKSAPKQVVQPSRSPSYIVRKSERLTILQAQRSRKSMLSHNRKRSRRRSTRLRSFSAAASSQAIRNRKPSKCGPKLEQLGESSAFKEVALKEAEKVDYNKEIIEEDDHDHTSSSESRHNESIEEEFSSSSSELLIQVPNLSWDPGGN